MEIGILIVLLAVLAGCGFNPHDEAKAKVRTEAFKVAVDNCLAAKGIPVFSGWDGRLMDCKPLPKGENNGATLPGSRK